MKKNILLLLACMSVLSLQSCFQDMERPGFDYPESTGELPDTPLKMYLPFDNEDIRDKGEYGFWLLITVMLSLWPKVLAVRLIRERPMLMHWRVHRLPSQRLFLTLVAVLLLFG